MFKVTTLSRIAVIVLSVFLLYFSTFFVPREIPSPAEIQIKDGMTFDQTVNALKARGIIKDTFIFRGMGLLTGADKRIKRGYYLFSGELSPYSILKRLVEGRVEEVRVTIPEGFNLWQIAERLDKKGIVKKEEFLGLAFNRNLLDKLDIKGPSLEGYLFPDTYIFPRGVGPVAVIRTMVDNMRRHLSGELLQEAERKGLTELEVLTLASIIEKEARVDVERPLISAVYHNRLKRGMPLQADPTTIYDLKDERRPVTRKDLLRDSPYNTYIHRGLPPGPIASPGLASIRAAVYPADVPYLYFVYSGEGRHVFSTTKEQHMRAVMRYKRNRK